MSENLRISPKRSRSRNSNRYPETMQNMPGTIHYSTRTTHFVDESARMSQKTSNELFEHRRTERLVAIPNTINVEASRHNPSSSVPSSSDTTLTPALIDPFSILGIQAPRVSQGLATVLSTVSHPTGTANSSYPTTDNTTSSTTRTTHDDSHLDSKVNELPQNPENHPSKHTLIFPDDAQRAHGFQLTRSRDFSSGPPPRGIGRRPRPLGAVAAALAAEIGDTKSDAIVPEFPVASVMQKSPNGANRSLGTTNSSNIAGNTKTVARTKGHVSDASSKSPVANVRTLFLSGNAVGNTTNTSSNQNSSDKVHSASKQPEKSVTSVDNDDKTHTFTIVKDHAIDDIDEAVTVPHRLERNDFMQMPPSPAPQNSEKLNTMERVKGSTSLMIPDPPVAGLRHSRSGRVLLLHANEGDIPSETGFITFHPSFLSQNGLNTNLASTFDQDTQQQGQHPINDAEMLQSTLKIAIAGAIDSGIHKNPGFSDHKISQEVYMILNKGEYSRRSSAPNAHSQENLHASEKEKIPEHPEPIFRESPAPEMLSRHFMNPSRQNTRKNANNTVGTVAALEKALQDMLQHNQPTASEQILHKSESVDSVQGSWSMSPRAIPGTINHHDAVLDVSNDDTKTIAHVNDPTNIVALIENHINDRKHPPENHAGGNSGQMTDPDLPPLNCEAPVTEICYGAKQPSSCRYTKYTNYFDSLAHPLADELGNGNLTSDYSLSQIAENSHALDQSNLFLRSSHSIDLNADHEHIDSTAPTRALSHHTHQQHDPFSPPSNTGRSNTASHDTIPRSHPDTSAPFYLTEVDNADDHDPHSSHQPSKLASLFSSAPILSHSPPLHRPTHNTHNAHPNPPLTAAPSTQVSKPASPPPLPSPVSLPSPTTQDSPLRQRTMRGQPISFLRLIAPTLALPAAPPLPVIVPTATARASSRAGGPSSDVARVGESLGERTKANPPRGNPSRGSQSRGSRSRASRVRGDNEARVGVGSRAGRAKTSAGGSSSGVDRMMRTSRGSRQGVRSLGSPGMGSLGMGSPGMGSPGMVEGGGASGVMDVVDSYVDHHSPSRQMDRTVGENALVEAGMDYTAHVSASSPFPVLQIGKSTVESPEYGNSEESGPQLTGLLPQYKNTHPPRRTTTARNRYNVLDPLYAADLHGSGEKYRIKSSEKDKNVKIPEPAEVAVIDSTLIPHTSVHHDILEGFRTTAPSLSSRTSSAAILKSNPSKTTMLSDAGTQIISTQRRSSASSMPVSRLSTSHYGTGLFPENQIGNSVSPPPGGALVVHSSSSTTRSRVGTSHVSTKDDGFIPPSTASSTVIPTATTAFLDSNTGMSGIVHHSMLLEQGEHVLKSSEVAIAASLRELELSKAYMAQMEALEEERKRLKNAL